MDNLRILITTILLTTMSLINPAVGQDSPPLLKEVNPTDLENSIPLLMKEAHIPGLSIALIRDGKVIWSEAFGVKSTKTDERCDEGTIFEAASLTKPFFAYIALLYVADGRLDLDIPLVDYLTEETIVNELKHPLDKPGFRRDWLEKITARHVLSHSSGMPHGDPIDSVYPLFFEPGSEYRYSADGYYFLQLTLENMEGMPLEEIARKRVLDPLGMTHSSLVWRDEYEETAAKGHDMFGEPQDHRRWSRALAGASMYTTAADYARFICAVLNNEQLSAAQTALMLTSQIEIDEHLSWSLGFGRQRDANGAAFWQWGDYGIYRNFVMAYEETKCGVVWLTNSFHGLSIVDDLAGQTVGGAVYARDFLGYLQYDSPPAQLAFLAMDEGAEVAIARLEELRKVNPSIVDQGAINSMGYSFLRADRIDDANALFEFNTRMFPESSNAWDSFAEGQMKAGRLDTAIAMYRRSIELDSTNNNARDRIDWITVEVQARDHPVQLTTEVLEGLVGQYGPRRIRLQADTLYYFRDGSGNPERFLYPLKPDLFGLQDSPDWRFRFDLDVNGQAIAIEGWTITGRVDRHERDK